MFGPLSKWWSGKSNEAREAAARKKLTKLIHDVLRDPRNRRIHVEDAVSLAATIVGERCIEVAGDYPLRTHSQIPGSRVFSTRANELICGDQSKVGIGGIPKESILGMLRENLASKTYLDAEFPDLNEVIAAYARNIGKVADWGWVPLSIDPRHRPIFPPLQVGYQTRRGVDQVLSGLDPSRALRVATESLADILMTVAPEIDHRIALMLAVETINGMAKTAPMTEEAMKKVKQPEPPSKG